MDFGRAFTLLMQGLEVRREGWPDGLRLKVAPATETEAAHPVIAYADGRESQPYAHNNLDLYHGEDWVLADGLPAGADGRDEAVKLLELALHLYQDGEFAPGGTETLHGWARETEAYLRSLLPPETVD